MRVRKWSAGCLTVNTAQGQKRRGQAMPRIKEIKRV